MDTMKQIWKYELEVTDDQYIPMPKGAKPLSVGVQGRAPVMWVEVDPEARQLNTHIRILSTGEPIPETEQQAAMKFVGTFQIGGFVGHVFAA
jgi:hypothetical protein